MTKYEVDFDDLWTLKENMKGIESKTQEIRKITKSVHIRELLIDEGITDIIEKNMRIINKYLEK